MKSKSRTDIDESMMSHQDKHDNIDLTIVSVKNRKRKNPLKQEHP